MIPPADESVVQQLTARTVTRPGVGPGATLHNRRALPVISAAKYSSRSGLPTTLSIDVPTAPSPEPGMLLIAPPMVQDPNFKRSVVFLCEHTPDGTFGLILNRPLGIRLEEVIDLIGDLKHPLLQGGPVQTDTLHFLHRLGERIPGHISISDEIYWGGDFEIMKALLEGGEISLQDVRFYLGYAGWSPGQLREEIDRGGWILAPGAGKAVFRIEPSDLWRTVLRSMGHEYAVLANFPEDPRLN